MIKNTIRKYYYLQWWRQKFQRCGGLDWLVARTRREILVFLAININDMSL